MNSRDYWERRAAQDMYDRMGTAEETAAEMNKAIQQTSAYLEKEVKAVMRGMQSFGISEAEAKKILNAAGGDGSALQRLRKAAQQVSDPERREALLNAINSAGAYRYRITRIEELNKDINRRCRELYKTENRHVTSALRNVAEDSYYREIFSIQKGTGLGFSFSKFPRQDVDRILRASWSGGNYSQRIWKDVSGMTARLKSELLVSMLSGRSGEKTARIFQEQFGVNAFCARRIVRTESAYVANAAQKSAYSEAGIERYRFVATLDSRTCECCAALDGKVFDLAKAKPGTNYPPMHPFCRSTTIADFGVEELKGLERRAKDKDGNTVKVPAGMSYEEWHRKFVGRVDKSAESGIMETRGTTIVNAESVVGKWQPRNQFSNNIDDIIDYQGFNGKPTIMYNQSEFEQAVERDHFLGERTFCADSQEDLQLYDKQLKAIDGEDYFYVNCGVGGAQYGQGMYCAADYTKGTITADKFEHEIQQYSYSDSHKFSKTNWLTLDPSAKVLEIPDGYDRQRCSDYVTRIYKEQYEKFRLSQDSVLKAHWEEYQSGMDEVRQLYSKWGDDAAWKKADKICEKLNQKFPDAHQLQNDINAAPNGRNAGILAAEMGYDAINASGHGTTNSYTVVLNRTKLIIFGGDKYEYRPKA